MLTPFQVTLRWLDASAIVSFLRGTDEFRICVKNEQRGRLWRGAFKANYRLHVSACGTCSATIMSREMTGYCIDADPTGQYVSEYGQQQACGDGHRDHSHRLSSPHG